MYLQRRGRKWLALHDVPADMQARLGRRRFVQSLGTEDYSEAKALGALLEAKWRVQIQAAREAASPDSLAAGLRAALRKAASQGERDLVSMVIDDHAARLFPGALDDPEMEDTPEYHEAGRFVALAHGQMVPLGEHLAEYISTLKVEAKTVAIRRANLEKFCKLFPTIDDVQRRGVQEWINSQAKAGAATGTIKSALSDARSYWRYLHSIEAVREDHHPFDRLTLPGMPKGNGKNERKPFTAGEVARLLEEARRRKDGQLADLIELGMYTGARIEELCALMVENVTANSFKITDAKTPAGQREIPIHSKLAPTMARLVAASTDGYVLVGLRADQYGDRHNALGSQFSRLKTALGFGKQHVFHSIRKTVATLLENAGVSENIAADILGHKKRTMSYGLYSGGTSLAMKREAIEKLDYSR